MDGQKIGYALARLCFPGSNFLGGGIFLAYLVRPTLLFLPIDRQIGLIQHLLGTHSHLSYPAHSLCPLAADGLLPRHSQGNRGERHGRRLHPGGNVGVHHPPPAIAAAAPSRHLLLHPLLERVSLCPDFHVLRADEDDPVGTVSDLIKADTLFWGSLMASAVLGSFPIAILYSFFVKYYVQGLTAGAVKG